MKLNKCDVCGCDTDEGINARATIRLSDKSVMLHITANVDDVDICDECAVKAFDFHRIEPTLMHPHDLRQVQGEQENKRLKRAIEFALNNVDVSRQAIRIGIEKILMERE